MLGGKNIQPPSCLRCTVLRKERLSSQGRQRGYNKLTFIVEMRRYLKEHVCGTKHPIYVIQLQKTACKLKVNSSQRNAFVLRQRMRTQNALLFEPQYIYVCMYVCMYTCGLTPVAFYVFLF